MPFRKREYLAIFVIALAVRMFALAALYTVPVSFDPDYVTDGWDTISNNVIEGHGISWTKDGSFPTISRGPVYPLFLAALIKVTNHNLLTVRLLYMVIDALIALLVLGLSYMVLGSRSAAIWSSIFYIVFLLPAWHVAKLAPDALFSLLLLVASMLFLKVFLRADQKRPSLSMAVVSGLVLGLAILTKKTILLLPLLWIVLALSKRGSRRSMSVALLVWLVASAAVVSPWLYRNYKLTGKFAFGQAMTWYVYWNGVMVDAELGHSIPGGFPEWAREYTQELRMDGHRTPIPLPPKEELLRAERLKNLAVRHMKEDFGYFLARYARNVVRFWYLSDTGRARLYTGIIGAIVFILFAFGTGFLFATRRVNRGAVFLLITIVYTNLVYAPVLAVFRYLIPVAPFIAVFVGFGLSRMWRLVRR